MTNPSKDALLPCPFCGGEAERFECEETDNIGGHVIGCTKCEASTRVFFGEMEGLYDCWQSRAQPSPFDAAEALEELNSLFYYECPFWVSALKNPKLSDKSMHIIRAALTAQKPAPEREVDLDPPADVEKVSNSTGLNDAPKVEPIEWLDAGIAYVEKCKPYSDMENFLCTSCERNESAKILFDKVIEAARRYAAQQVSAECQKTGEILTDGTDNVKAGNIQVPTNIVWKRAED